MKNSRRGLSSWLPWTALGCLAWVLLIPCGWGDGGVAAAAVVAAKEMTSPASPTPWHRVALLHDDLPGLDRKIADRIAELLKKDGLNVTPLRGEQLADPACFGPARFDGLVLTYSPAFPAAAEKNLLKFIGGGGDLVLLGGEAFSRPLWKVRDRWLDATQIVQSIDKKDWPEGFNEHKEIAFYAAFEDYDVYRLRGVTRIQACASQDLLPAAPALEGQFEGISAIGFGYPRESVFLPLLSALDRHRRPRGWAGGIQVNYAGPYPHSQWILCGLTTPEFYQSEWFGRMLTAMIGQLRDGARLERWAEAENKKSADRTVECQIAPPPPVHLNKKAKRFETPDGRPFYIIGCNYLGPMRLKYNSDDAGAIEEDFKRMNRYGINTIRIWGIGSFLTPRGATLLKQCARKYGVYLLPVIGEGAYLTDRATARARARQVAEVFKGEPMLLGYDLMNEPYFWELGKMKDETGRTLWDRFTVPANGWKYYEDWAGLHAQEYCSSFPGVKGPLPYPQDEIQRRTFDSVDRIYAAVIGWLTEGVRAVDPGPPLTVGYNTVWSCMPANRPLDFVANHLYLIPEHYDRVKLNLVTLDTLAAVWPDRPIVVGEFGYSGGDRVGGKLMDVETIAVGEMMHYLYPLARGYSGTIKWMLNDFSRWNDRRQVQWIPWENRDEHLKQARCGIFFDNGTPEGAPKPLAYGLQFLREYADSSPSGDQMQIRPAKTAIGTGYTYEGRRALFVGDLRYESPRLAFESERPVNVMLRWQEEKLRAMATGDVIVRFKPAAFVSILTPVKARITGARGNIAVHGEWLEIELLEGETVTLQ